jgi:hypothetical protein
VRKVCRFALLEVVPVVEDALEVELLVELPPFAAWTAETKLLKSDCKVLSVLSEEVEEVVEEVEEPLPNSWIRF